MQVDYFLDCSSHTDAPRHAPLGPSPHTVAPRETKLHWRTPETYNPEQICLIFWHIEG